jgi:hypothetical protein
MSLKLQVLPRPIEPIRLPPASELRAWAIKKGWDVGTYGRLAPEIGEAWVEAELKKRRRQLAKV